MNEPIQPLAPTMPINPLPVGYYTSTRRKWGDFFIGLVGFTIAAALVGTLVGMFSSSLSVSLSILSLPFMIFLFIYFRRKGRRFISLGILMAVLIPIVVVALFFGACLIAASTGNLSF